MRSNALLPEWHPVESVLLAWPYPHGDWESNYDQVEDCYFGILQALCQRVLVRLLFHPTLDLDAFERSLLRYGINEENLSVTVLPYNDTWIRDYGPLSTEAGYLTFQFNGWGGKYPAELDNVVSARLFEQLGRTLTDSPFVCEGGALETNGHHLLMNDKCVVDEKRNPNMPKHQVEQLLIDELGAKQCLWVQDICLTGDDTDGHIDTIVRFSDRNSLVFSGPNPEHQDAQALASLNSQVLALAEQNQWQVFSLPSPEYRSLLDGRLLPCTYANFLICNQFVFAPVYGLPEDSQALAVLAKAFPNSEVVPVRCEALLEQHGSLHCATMQIADLTPVE